MASIILRQSNVITSPGATVKGSPLTNAEVDNNFANLNVQVSDIANVVTVTGGVFFANAHIIPTLANIYDLGNATLRFDDIFLSGNIDLDGVRITTDAGGNVLIGGNVAFNSSGQLAVSNVGTTNLADNAVTTPKIAESAVTTARLNDLAVTEGKIAASAVTETKIGSSAVTAAKIGAGAVTETKIGSGAVTEAKIGSGAVTSAKIAAGAVGTTQLATSGVSAGTYGNAVSIPTFIVDATGRITSASNVAITVSGGSGSGNFNTAINRVAGYALTDGLITAVTMPSTASTRYIIHSIHVTNIDTIDGSVTGQFNGTNMTNIAFTNTVPVPVNSAVELLKKPKVLFPSATIDLQQETGAGNLHATITYETVTGTSHFGGGVDITSTDTYEDLLIATGNAVIESVLLTNDNGALDVKATVVWTNAANAIQGYYVFDYIVPADATVEILDMPKFLESGFKVRVKANQPNRLEALIAGKYA